MHLRFDANEEELLIQLAFDGTLHFRCFVPNFRVWEPQSPTPHTVTLTISDPDGCISSRMTVRFGIRTIAVREGRLELNEKPILLLDYNRHEWHPNMNMTLGQRLRELRLKNDLSLRELGNQVSKTATFLSDVELGQRFPSEDLFKILAMTLKTTVEDLSRYDQRPPTREIQDLATFNPQFGFAFRRALDVIKEQNLSPEAFVKRVEGQHKLQEKNKE